jgi:hypothetical protein
VRPAFRYIVIALVIVSALVGAFQFGYFVADAMRHNKESTEIRRLNKRIRELEERETTERPPKKGLRVDSPDL